MSGLPTSSSRPTPEVGVAAVYRGRELRVVCVAQALLVLVVVVGWAVVAGTQAAALDDAGIFSGIATAVAAVVGVVLVTLRGPGRPDAGDRFMRMGFVLPGMLAFALIQLPLAFLVAVLGDELMWVVVGSMIGLVVAASAGSLLANPRSSSPRGIAAAEVVGLDGSAPPTAPASHALIDGELEQVAHRAMSYGDHRLGRGTSCDAGHGLRDLLLIVAGQLRSHDDAVLGGRRADVAGRPSLEIEDVLTTRAFREVRRWTAILDSSGGRPLTVRKVDST